MKKTFSVFILLFFIFCISAQAATYYSWRYREHATDCTALTDGKVKDLCYEVDADTFYKCEPTAGDCSGSEWKPLNTTGNAATSTALAANGANCSAGSAPLGVDASGASESCTDYEEDLSNSAGLAAAISDETGTGVVVFGTGGVITLGENSTVPNGAAPTSDAAGEAAVDTTDDQFQYYGAAKRVLPYTYERCFTVQTPVAGDDNVPFFSPVDAITVTGVYCRTQGGTSVGVTISDGTNAFEEVVCDSDGQADDGSITNATFTANERMEFDTGTVTGTVDWNNVCIRYTVDSQ